MNKMNIALHFEGEKLFAETGISLDKMKALGLNEAAEMLEENLS